jgi:hypothetical protein
MCWKLIGTLWSAIETEFILDNSLLFFVLISLDSDFLASSVLVVQLMQLFFISINVDSDFLAFGDFAI